MSYFGNGDVLKELDVIELSALWYHLPKWQDISRFIWRARLKLRLDSLVFKEMMEGLEWELIRNAAYEVSFCHDCILYHESFFRLLISHGNYV